MKEFTKYKFSELYGMSSGISTSKDQAGHGSPFVSFSSVFNNYFLPCSLPDRMFTSEKEQKTYSVKEGDIFLTRTSETLDELGMSCVVTSDHPETTYSGFLKRLRPVQQKKAYHKYMAFYLRSKLFRKTMNNNAVMTLRCSLNEQIFSYLDLLLPDYSEQIKIGDFLYLIHQKIELNNRINAELEGMAKLLYDYWFVQFEFPITAVQAAAMGKPHLEGKPYKSSGGPMTHNPTLKRDIPEGWKDGALGSVFKLYQPQTISEKDMDPEGAYWVYGANGIVGKFGQYNHEHSELALTCRGSTCGNLTKTLPFSWITGNAMVMSPKADTWDVEFSFNLASNSGIHSIITGSGQPQITRANLEGVKCTIPNKESIEAYCALSKTITNQRVSLVTQNQHLTSLRDWLLPMLMNGQVTVK